MIFYLEIILILLAALIAVRFLIIQYFTRKSIRDYIRGESPFIPTRPENLAEIAKALKIEERSRVYDLGSGDARVLVACADVQSSAEYIGVEKDSAAYLWSKLRLRLLGKAKRINIVKKDFFDVDLSDATHIFFYLIPKQIEKLLPKLEKGLKSGTKIISLKYVLPGKNSVETIDLGKEKLFVYVY